MKNRIREFREQHGLTQKNWEDPLESPVRRSMQWKRENLIYPSGLPTI